MVDLDRRGFLKGMAILTASTQVDFFKLSNRLIERNDYTSFGLWRPMAVYDEQWGEITVRYDIITRGNVQIHVGSRPGDIPFSEVDDYRERIHEPMVQVLQNELNRRKIRRKDLVKFAHLQGYSHPPEFAKLLTLL